MKHSFAVFDTDGSGKLSIEEFKGILMRNTQTSKLSDDDAKAIIEEFDKNGDSELDISEVRPAVSPLCSSCGAQQPPCPYCLLLSCLCVQFLEAMKAIDERKTQ